MAIQLFLFRFSISVFILSQLERFVNSFFVMSFAFYDVMLDFFCLSLSKIYFQLFKKEQPQKISVATLNDYYALYQLNILICRGLTIYCFFWHLFIFRELNKTTLLVKAPQQVIMTAVHETSPALIRHKIISIGEFDNLPAQVALYSILDNLSHTIPFIANTIPQQFRKVQAFE